MMFEAYYPDREFDYCVNDVDVWTYRTQISVDRSLTREEDEYLRTAITNAATRALNEIKDGCLK